MERTIEFILKMLIKEGFRCEIEEKAIIFFKSKYLKHERQAIIIPIRVKERTDEDKDREDKKKELEINLNIP